MSGNVLTRCDGEMTGVSNPNDSNDPNDSNGSNGHALTKFRLMLVEELERELEHLVGELLGLQVAELLLERPERDDGLGHRAMAAGAADVVEVLPHELAGVA